MSEVSWPVVLDRLISGSDLSRDEAYSVMTEIMTGNASDSQIAGFLVALRVKGETSEEMTGLVDAMVDASVTVDVGEPVVDSVGTGGDGFGTFNISTTAAFIAAGVGVKVAKHGNRAASSKTGSADVLEALGFNLEMAPDDTVAMIKDVGFGFFFAPRYHPAMRHAGPVRSSIGIRTVFNFLGPLTNPAGAKLMSVGTADRRMARLMIEVLKNRGAERAFVFYGEDGLDELTTTGPSFIYRLRSGEVTTAEFTPEDFGVRRAVVDDLKGGTVDENAAILLEILDGVQGPKRDIAMVNAAPAIVVAGLADGFVEAVDLAKESIDSGDARAVLDRSIAFTKSR
ncbi:MAG: anthranilate phosphoribosyltransferase, partial [Actinomycetota bacterium]|nr:anthranilate phosphoribosyltransferase [Actinomycetota bacterium]